jgi:hypothetical protein
LAVKLDDGHIAANVAKAAQWDDAHCVWGQQGRDLQTTGCHVSKGYRPDTIAAVGAASGEPIAASVRLAWPAEASSIAELQRRSWATQWPAELAELMLSSVSLAEMNDSWRTAIERPPAASFRVLVATDGKRVVGFATTMPNQDDDADRRSAGSTPRTWLPAAECLRRHAPGRRLRPSRLLGERSRRQAPELSHRCRLGCGWCYPRNRSRG